MFMLLPVTLYYFSPVLSLESAASGIVSGSIIIFGFLFLFSLFFGRLFCGWICPAGGEQELIMLVRRKAVNRKRINWIKWIIWVPWITALALFVLQAGGVKNIDFLYQTRSGISVTDMPGLIAFLSVVFLFFILAVTIGKRAGCHTICWMAPFMIIGRSLRNIFTWPSLRLAAVNENCVSCGKCTKSCPMSIAAMEKVRENHMESRDCILCGSCVDTCPKKVIRYTFSSGF